MSYHGAMSLILVVDDDLPTLYGLAALLKSAGHTVSTAADFAEGRRRLLTIQPDMLIADIRLHQYNGLELVVIAQSLTPPPVAIVTSGFHDEVLKKEAGKMGASFLEKPFDPARLLALVDELLPPPSNA
jgi:DNA-binding response OmpR family regulator